ncbi:MAG: hypothetical protein B6D41_04835 [Chloroflexi bacterium UTCFX4]|jgi:beta-N-acetylhexosaminidase|nr:MAG: hypothetical protein B6D41_04835 [Chloroflexi bacterium UTCFX4]
MPSFSRRQLLALGGQTFLLALASCANNAPISAPTANSPHATAHTPTSTVTKSTTMPTPNEITLDAKIGQMLLLGFRGYELQADDAIVQDLCERNLGAVVLFSYDGELKKFERNIASPAQVQALNASLQAFAQTPLLITIDQEGGAVSRLAERFGFPPTQSQEFYGAQNDVALTRAAAEAEGKILRDLGINLNLAPVVDVNLNPHSPAIGKNQRSFSADPRIVTAHARATIEGYHSQNVLTTLKHFPGHGSAASDSHLGFVDVTTTWQALELEPYRELIRAGLADAIMTAHIFNANLDAQYPATLSRKIITGILRQHLGYDGVVMSDDMQMGAISRYYGFEQALELAIHAGVDMLALANNLAYDPTIGARAFGVIKQLVRDGKISEQRIDESYQRIMRLKARLKP